MVKLNTIKIVTGYKGGVGKTLTSLALTIDSIRRNATTLALDMNANNPNLTEILTNLYSDDYKINELKYLRWRFPIDDTNKQLIAIKPLSPIWSEKNFWDFINSLIKYEINSAVNIITDTHFSIAHLFPEEIHQTDTIIEKEKINIETYFIWNLASPDKKYELNAITNTIRNMEKSFKNSYKSSNQIHIFNPHEAKSPRTFFSRALKKEWVKRMELRKGKVISIDTLTKLISDTNIEFDYKTEIEPSKLFEVWENFFQNILDLTKGYCCFNILPIFEFFDLSNFTTGQIYSKNRNIRSIQNDMEPFYNYINRFETMRNKFKNKSLF